MKREMPAPILVLVLILLCIVIVILAAPGTSAAPSPQTYYVSTSGSDADDGLSWGSAFRTIQHAVDIASPGDTIIVGDGTYVESVPVNKGDLTLRSENGAAKTVIQTPNPDIWYVLQISANNVTIDGFTVENATRYWTSGISNDADNCTISNNVLRNNNYGICLFHSGNNTLENNTLNSNNYGIYLFRSNNNVLKNNTFVNDGLAVGDSYGNLVENNIVNGKPLVYLENESNRTITSAGQVVLVGCDNITVEGLDLSSTNIGVELWETKNSKIINNILENNRFDGIWLLYSSNNTLENNTAQNNRYGITLGSSDHNMLENNTLTSNETGIQLDGSNNNTLENNHISNSGNGVMLTCYSGWSMSMLADPHTVLGMNIFCDNNLIKYNNILNNDNGIYLNIYPSSVIENGVLVEKPSINNTAHFNNITGNSEYGVFCERGTIHAESNWWGDLSGPGGAGPGTGDAVSEDVVYEPWLDAPVGQGVTTTTTTTSPTTTTSTTTTMTTPTTTTTSPGEGASWVWIGVGIVIVVVIAVVVLVLKRGK